LAVSLTGNGFVLSVSRLVAPSLVPVAAVDFLCGATFPASATDDEVFLDDRRLADFNPPIGGVSRDTAADFERCLPLQLAAAGIVRDFCDDSLEVDDLPYAGNNATVVEERTKL
jgi:hypothetical protein